MRVNKKDIIILAGVVVVCIALLIIPDATEYLPTMGSILGGAYGLKAGYNALKKRKEKKEEEMEAKKE